MSCGEVGEEEGALNFVEIIANKQTMRIEICDFFAGGLTCLNMELMLLRMMVLGEELREEENEKELLEEA